MCGLTGFLTGSTIDATESAQIGNRMADSIRHRGPDDQGEWCEPESGLVLAFRRLAIIDLSEHGHQPMFSHAGRYAIIFNGEVYNFEAIRNELGQIGKAPKFRGHSDTEVILAAMEAWGVFDAVERFNGMFALAVWDRELKVLHLTRDRAGVKPLYYGFLDGTFVFASELKALRRHPAFSGKISRRALELYMRLMYVPGPLTIYENILKLQPGTILSVRAKDLSTESRSYWAAASVAQRMASRRFSGSEDQAADRLDAIIHDSVRLRMISDVPIGVFLSGGIDSSLVTAIMQSESARPIQSFTIGFREDAFNEAVHAQAVAAQLGTDHHELYLNPDDALSTVARMPVIFDEPFADSSQIPTYLLSRFARQKITVCLSGDGGDELFGGYARHIIGAQIWNVIETVPTPFRSIAARLLIGIAGFAARRPAFLRAVAPRSFEVESWIRRVGKLPYLLGSRSREDFYARLLTQWHYPEKAVIGGTDAIPTLPATKELRLTTSEWLMLLDFVSYLPDDLLTKVDRASMAVSLEVREPLLDPRLVEFAWSLPPSMRVSSQASKRLLRRVLHRYVPRKLVDRPKMGFAVPLGQWLRGPLRSWGEKLLERDRLEAEGFFDSKAVCDRWRAHQDGSENSEHALWTVLMFEAWLDATQTESRAEYQCRETSELLTRDSRVAPLSS